MNPPVHSGAIVLLVGVVQFVIVGMALTQLKYPGYSLTGNYISDLGNTSTSPWYFVFNGSIIALGVLSFFGVLMIWGAFKPGLLRLAGLALLLVASIAAIGVGVFPENVNGGIHGLASLLVFLPSGLAMVLLSGTMLRDTRWQGFRFFTFLLGVITLVALALYLPQYWGPLGPGGLERIVVYPVLIWAFVISIHLRQLPSTVKIGHLAKV